MEEFLLALENLITHEANNGDYYVDGYVDACELADIINKYFPERKFAPYANYCRWYGPRPKTGKPSFIPAIYSEAIARQLDQPTFLTVRVKKEPND